MIYGVKELHRGSIKMTQTPIFGNVFEGKRVLVTGHTGFKGSWLCHWLLLLGADVTGFSVGIPTSPSMFEVLNLGKRLRHVIGDVRNFEFLAGCMQETQAQIVFHLAGQSLVRQSYDNPKQTFDINLGGTVNVLEAVRHCPSVRAAVVITSDKCYENNEWDYGYRETDRLGGRDPYSASKACAEIAFHAYICSFFSGKNETFFATARAGNVIGGGDWSPDRIVPDCIRSWTIGQTVIVRNPESTRPWQHVLEPLSGYLSLGAKLFQGTLHLSGESFNFGPSFEAVYSVQDLLDEMQKIWTDGKWTKAEQLLECKPEASLLKLSCDKVLKKLAWKATLSYQETVDMTIDWYLKFYNYKVDMANYTTEQILSYQKIASERGLMWARP